MRRRPNNLMVLRGHLIAIATDGTMWILKSQFNRAEERWERLPDLPQPDPIPPTEGA